MRAVVKCARGAGVLLSSLQRGQPVSAPPVVQPRLLAVHASQPAAARRPPLVRHHATATATPAPLSPPLTPAPGSPPAPRKPVTFWSDIGQVAFVGREDAALDVLAPNLHNMAALSAASPGSTLFMPVALQRWGTGKTRLGRQLAQLLQRPRDAPDVEAAVAERLKHTWTCTSGMGDPSAVDRALAEPTGTSSDNLLVRTLRHMYPGQARVVDSLKGAKTAAIRIVGLHPDFFNGDDADRTGQAVAYAIWAAAHDMDANRQPTLDAFEALPAAGRSAAGVAAAIIEASGGAPLIVVVDGMTRGYWNLPGGMPQLATVLRSMLSVRGCLIYCNASGMPWSWAAPVFAGAHAGDDDDAAVEGLPALHSTALAPVVLQPLSPEDVLRVLQDSHDNDGVPLADLPGVHPDQRRYFARAAVAWTGGLADAIKELLRSWYNLYFGSAVLVDSQQAVDARMKAATQRLAEDSGLRMRTGFRELEYAAHDLKLPSWVKDMSRTEQAQLLARLLLLEPPLSVETTVTMGRQDAANVVSLAAAHNLTVARRADGRGLRLVGGGWFCRQLLAWCANDDEGKALAAACVLAAVMQQGGSMRGRAMELLCAEAVYAQHWQHQCQRQWADPVLTLAASVPACSGTALANAAVKQLACVAIPPVTPDAPRLSPTGKKRLLASRDLTSASAVHAADVQWLLSEWLQPGTLAIPADAKNVLHSMFLRVEGGVVGFAFKACGAAGITWGDVRAELARVPAMRGEQQYVLVLYSLHLSPPLQLALGGQAQRVFGPGCWKVTPAHQLKAAGTRAARGFVFKVPERTQLVVVNPHAGGLDQLLGAGVARALQEEGSGELDVVAVDKIMSAEREAVLEKQQQQQQPQQG